MKKLVKLSYIKKLHGHMEADNGFIQVLLGPRQVGKTTSTLHLLSQHFKATSDYISLEKVFNPGPEFIVENWSRAHKDKKILVIDEIQKCESWSETIKFLYDENKRLGIKTRVVLLGSSSLEIQKGLTESLTGRFQLIQAHHWNFDESNRGYKLSLDECLKFGGYPGSYPLIEQHDSWVEYLKNSIVGTVVEKDILQYQSVRSPALFRQAFEIIVGYPAQEISYTKLLGQIQDRGNVELVKHYLRLYEGAFLIKTIEKYSNKIVKTKTSSPKILPLAPCLYYLTVIDDYQSDEQGRAFELLVGAQLVRTGWPLYYWRQGKDEVDFVLKKGRRLWAIEVKSGRKKSAKGLMKFKTEFPQASPVIITKDNYIQFEKDPLAFLER
ncbi:MAG: ATP-binding protein [Bdellovibrionales bacterium]|nr:ATP-binding protein [Bdellovibrionales bacterium]